MKRIALLALLGLLMNACQVAAPLPIPTDAFPPKIISTPTLLNPIETATEAPTATATVAPTPAKTSTVASLKLVTSLDYSNEVLQLPLITMEDMTSGRLAASERVLLAEGKITCLSSDAFLGTIQYAYYDQHEHPERGWGLFAFNTTVSEYQKYIQNRESRPICGASYSRMIIEGHDILIMGLQWLNSDKSIGLIHFGYQDWRNQARLGYLTGAFVGDNSIGVICRIDNEEALSTLSDPNKGIDFRRETAIVKLYNDSGLRENLCQQWAASGVLPAEAEKLIFIPFRFPRW
jgi:hypothetical protein